MLHILVISHYLHNTDTIEYFNLFLNQIIAVVLHVAKCDKRVCSEWTVVTTRFDKDTHSFLNVLFSTLKLIKSVVGFAH